MERVQVKMPHVARLYALPRRYAESGVLCYALHGLSCEYVMEELRVADPPAQYPERGTNVSF